MHEWAAEDFERVHYPEHPLQAGGRLQNPIAITNLRTKLREFRSAAEKSRPDAAREMLDIVKYFATDPHYFDECDKSIKDYNIRDFEGEKSTNHNRELLLHAYVWINWRPYRQLWAVS